MTDFSVIADGALLKSELFHWEHRAANCDDFNTFAVLRWASYVRECDKRSLTLLDSTTQRNDDWLKKARTGQMQ